MRLLVLPALVVLGACSQERAREPIEPAPTPATAAPPAPRPVMAATWPIARGPDEPAHRLAGPFASPEAFCSAVDVPAGKVCGPAEAMTRADMGAPFLELGYAGIVPRPDPYGGGEYLPPAHPDPLFVGVRTSAGWYFMPALYPSGEHEVWLVTGGEVHGGRLALRYRHMRAPQDPAALRVDDGLILCGADAAGAVSCSGGVTTSWMDATHDSVCAAEVGDDGHLRVRDPAEPARPAGNGKGKDDGKAKGKAAAKVAPVPDAEGITHLPCRESAFFGDHAIAFAD
ncbi:MAG: hypothetical protein K8W52_27475 [Deltaproteobacteria bacterium]|nr:hypothetical protein [Deltaproteobacteria bacterium]